MATAEARVRIFKSWSCRAHSELHESVWSWRGQERYSRKTEAADLRRAFTILDAKKDDRVDAEELAQLFRRLGHKEKRVHDRSTSCSSF